MGRLQHAFERHGVNATILDAVPAEPGGRVLFVAGPDGGIAGPLLAAAGVTVPALPEAFAIVSLTGDVDDDFLLSGADERGLVYAVLEVADRVEHADDPFEELPREPIVEHPANTVRSVTRAFCSEVEDMSWFTNDAFWDRYLSMLATQRFNRFSLTLGLGYNYHRDISDAYLYFAYPFLVSVPGFDVRVPQITEEERARNLIALRTISDGARARGLDFQLGLWTHAFSWIDSPNAHQTIEGLTPERHAAYCRDAVQVLLEECPAIGGLTFRIHGEGGVPEGSYDFWQSVFGGVAAAGRTVGIDLHAKGLDERMLGLALDTGQPVTVSMKFWAEHMGPGYHQAAIRESERRVRPDPSDRSEWHRYMTVSEGSRPFTRYGYADFLREDRDYDVVFRLWAGTQRLLLWGDPAMASAYGRAAHLAGAQGLEWFEPLTFKGREGSGVAGARTGYADPSLVATDDWEKYAHAYRLFGRLLYDPDASPEGWRRAVPASPESAGDAEASLAGASRILPLFTVAHHPSASNNYFWPEVYTDMPIVWTDEGTTRPHPYFDTPEPHRFGNVGSLDPEVFSSVIDFVRETLDERPSGRISPLEVAERLDEMSTDAARSAGAVPWQDHADPRRWQIDIAILCALGAFFAGKLRAAVWYEVFALTGDTEASRRALDAYRVARDAWSDVVTSASVYVDDLTFGPEQRLRGHWKDRLAASEDDLRDMEERAAAVGSGTSDAALIERFLAATARPANAVVVHDPPETFEPGQALGITMQLMNAPGARVELRFRPMNQALAMSSERMRRTGDVFAGQIPGEATDGVFPLSYAFVVHEGGRAWRHPGIGADLATQPYFVVRRAHS